MTPAAQALADKPILRPPSIRCRSLTVSGRMCKATALLGQDFCYQHAKTRHLVLPRGPNITLPLLEDLDSIRVFVTQISQGILAESINFRDARTLFYGCQVASNTMPRPARLKPTQEQETPAEPVTEVFESPDGRLLGPIEDSRAKAKFSSYWSFDKLRYEQECERLGLPLPQTPADMPESGWLTPDDLENLERQRAAGQVLLDTGYRDKMLELRLDADRRGILPPLAERKCSYGDESWCQGPGARGKWQSACDRCTRERDEYCRLHPDEPKPVCYSDKPTDLQAVAEDPSTPPVKSVNIVNPRESSRSPHPTPYRGVPPFHQFGGARNLRFRGTTSVILSGFEGNAMLQPESLSISIGRIALADGATTPPD